MAIWMQTSIDCCWMVASSASASNSFASRSTGTCTHGSAFQPERLGTGHDSSRDSIPNRHQRKSSRTGALAFLLASAVEGAGDDEQSDPSQHEQGDKDDKQQVAHFIGRPDGKETN